MPFNYDRTADSITDAAFKPSGTVADMSNKLQAVLDNATQGSGAPRGTRAVLTDYAQDTDGRRAASGINTTYEQGKTSQSGQAAHAYDGLFDTVSAGLINTVGGADGFSGEAADGMKLATMRQIARQDVLGQNHRVQQNARDRYLETSLAYLAALEQNQAKKPQIEALADTVDALQNVLRKVQIDHSNPRLSGEATASNVAQAQADYDNAQALLMERKAAAQRINAAYTNDLNGIAADLSPQVDVKQKEAGGWARNGQGDPLNLERTAWQSTALKVQPGSGGWDRRLFEKASQTGGVFAAQPTINGTPYVESVAPAPKPKPEPTPKKETASTTPAPTPTPSPGGGGGATPPTRSWGKGPQRSTPRDGAGSGLSPRRKAGMGADDILDALRRAGAPVPPQEAVDTARTTLSNAATDPVGTMTRVMAPGMSPMSATGILGQQSQFGSSTPMTGLAGQTPLGMPGAMGTFTTPGTTHMGTNIPSTGTGTPGAGTSPQTGGPTLKTISSGDLRNLLGNIGGTHTSVAGGTGPGTGTHASSGSGGGFRTTTPPPTVGNQAAQAAGQVMRSGLSPATVESAAGRAFGSMGATTAPAGGQPMMGRAGMMPMMPMMPGAGMGQSGAGGGRGSGVTILSKDKNFTGADQKAADPVANARKVLADRS